MEVRENPLRAEKRKKLAELREKGIDPFPHSYKPTDLAGELTEKFDSKLSAGDHLEDETTSIAGRLMTKRDMGKAAFFNIQDQSGSMQVYVKVKELPEVQQQAFNLLDIGDYVGVKGFVFKTKKGQLSVRAQELQILCKTLEPLPEKYHGIADVELKYRQRHLDLIMSPESRKVFETRSKIIKEIRNYLDERGFLEVETPVLQPIYGGAAAYPFSTHHRALDMKLYLKISPELYLKRLIVGGFHKVYEMVKVLEMRGLISHTTLNFHFLSITKPTQTIMTK